MRSASALAAGSGWNASWRQAIWISPGCQGPRARISAEGATALTVPAPGRIESPQPETAFSPLLLRPAPRVGRHALARVGHRRQVARERMHHDLLDARVVRAGLAEVR